MSPAPSLEQFLAVYAEIKAYLLQDAEQRMEVDPNRLRYLGKMMDTTCLGGKYNRGLAVVETGHRIALSHGLSDEHHGQILHDCAVAGWLIEFLQAHFLTEDDIMDHSVMRRGKPCWYRFPGVTTQVAINDGLIILAWCSAAARHFFRSRPDTYMRVMDLLHEQDYRTTIGQLYDVSAMFDSAKFDPETPVPTTTDYKEFTLHHYRRIVKFKTSYYTFYLPLALGLAICHDLVPAGIAVEPIACIMGEYFQIQDDFLDCFGDPAVIQKIGTDIEDKKCSWLAVTFLSIASEAQRHEFAANYGQVDKEAVARVKQLYRDTKVEDAFLQYEEVTLAAVHRELDALTTVYAPFAEAVRTLWSRTYKRTK